MRISDWSSDVCSSDLAPADARRREEPGRPSARRWRRPDLGRPSSGNAVGQADQGCAHAPQQADRQDDHPVASREEEEVIMARHVWKGLFVDLHLLKKEQAVLETTARMPIKISSRRSKTMHAFVARQLRIYKGRKIVTI